MTNSFFEVDQTYTLFSKYSVEKQKYFLTYFCLTMDGRICKASNYGASKFCKYYQVNYIKWNDESMFVLEFHKRSCLKCFLLIQISKFHRLMS